MSGNSCSSALHTAPIVIALRGAPASVGVDLGGDGFRFVLDGHERHCERKVSLNLPTCSSSPSSRRWDSMR